MSSEIGVHGAKFSSDADPAVRTGRSDMLTNGEDIAIRVLEPCDLITGGSGPNSLVLILREGELFRSDAIVPEPSGDRFDILHFPAKDSALQGCKIWNF